MEDAIEMVVDKNLEEASNQLRGDMHNQIRDEMREQSNMLRDEMQQFMLMFLSQAQMRMSPDFPPRERLEPILPGVGTRQRMVGSSKVEIDPVAMENNVVDRRHEVQVNSNDHNFPVLKLELPVFDESKPRWWI